MIAYFRTIDDDVIDIVSITCIIMRIMINGRKIIIAILIIIMSMITINIMSILIY